MHPRRISERVWCPTDEGGPRSIRLLPLLPTMLPASLEPADALDVSLPFRHGCMPGVLRDGILPRREGRLP